MRGEMPVSDDEIAVDRMYAQNNGIDIADELIVDGKSFRISGLIALPDYSALFRDNDDMMFDASLFGTAIVTDASFEKMDNLRYCYAWKYRRINDGSDEKKLADDFMKELNRLIKIEEYVPRYHFIFEDEKIRMGEDGAKAIEGTSAVMHNASTILISLYNMTSMLDGVEAPEC